MIKVLRNVIEQHRDIGFAEASKNKSNGRESESS